MNVIDTDDLVGKNYAVMRPKRSPPARGDDAGPQASSYGMPPAQGGVARGASVLRPSGPEVYELEKIGYKTRMGNFQLVRP